MPDKFVKINATSTLLGAMIHEFNIKYKKSDVQCCTRGCVQMETVSGTNLFLRNSSKSVIFK